MEVELVIASDPAEMKGKRSWSGDRPGSKESEIFLAVGEVNVL